MLYLRRSTKNRISIKNNNMIIRNSFVSGTLIKKSVSPREFLRIINKNVKAIRSSKFVPPVLGEEFDFGKIVIQYDNAKRK